MTIHIYTMGAIHISGTWSKSNMDEIFGLTLPLANVYATF
jgi:hypothetical protein